MTNPICSPSKNHRLPEPFHPTSPSLSSGPSSYLSFAPGSASLVSKGLWRCCQGFARRRVFWQEKGGQLSSRWQPSERHLMGLGTFVNLQISLGCDAQNDLETEPETRDGIFGLVTILPTSNPSTGA